VFTASEPFFLFDEFRVPYARADGAEPDGAWATLTWTADGRSRAVWWPRAPRRHPGAREGAWRAGTVPLFGHVVPDLPPRTPARIPVVPVTGRDGRMVAAIRRGLDGSLLLPFDPGELALNLWSERYLRIGRGSRSGTGARRHAKRAYYALRPLLPRGTQVALRRRLARVQQRSAFPRWPSEPALHDLYDLLFGLLARVAGAPLPRIAAWPGGRSWCLVLTHDVETAAGHRDVGLLRERELRHGVRSAWNFVPLRYDVDDALVGALRADGFEVGVHGLYHDGRDLAPGAIERRLPQMRDYGARWGAAGFRSPALNRDWATMPTLGFAYDSSSPDTDPFGPDGGGCCSWLPFRNGDLVELPVTLAQDHTLFEILRRAEPGEWFAKTEAIRARGGMALLITHPDYMTDPGRLDAYERFIARFAPDASAWTALPRDVAAWWRRRAASTVVAAGDGWAIRGPAAPDGRIELVGSDGRAAPSPEAAARAPVSARNGAR
jgi:hypothetical protein